MIPSVANLGILGASRKIEGTVTRPRCFLHEAGAPPFLPLSEFQAP
jgi:hypothetical protein